MDGILIIDKEKDYTSRDVVNIVGKKFKTKKVGHTGTLDPLATGVLVVCVNKATKVCELLTSLDKEYIADFKLGLLTDTLDIEGNILKEEKININKEDLILVLNKIKGKYMQTVPIYSAIKVNGKKLYEYARNNTPVELPKHEVDIKEIELLEFNGDSFKIRTKVSKGTYIRSLGNDIAQMLNTNATMTNLRRTKQGLFDIKDAIKINDINEDTNLIKITDVLNYPKVIADINLEKDLLDGKILNNTFNNDIILFVDNNNNPISLYKIYDKDNTKIKPWKTFKIK
ncbi:MAG: tRNA pseudouridine(55) synthase TruB [Bacilli bacterium]|jgi:tRNA pseudouridine55 synthase|nr:tRNA pseudouridine(55) synthase TruB [Bacilli bacterium]